MKTKAANFCTELPENYKEVYHIDGRQFGWTVKFTLASLVMMAAVIVPAFIFGNISLVFSISEDYIRLIVALVVFIIVMIGYTIAHELVHGAAYKALTGSKLTFGITLTVAYCGVPDIYVYRRAALIALLAPFVVFSVLFVALTTWLYFVDKLYYAVISLILGIHFGGCVGDLFTALLLIFKLRDNRLLVRDTGPEQTFWLPEDV